MGQVVLALCPLTTGRTLSDDEKATLTALQEYATQLAAFIQTGDLTQSGLALPSAMPGLLDYPYVLNPTYEAD